METENAKISSIMKEAVEVSRNALGDTLRQVCLFGSYARGDANKDSDVDFLVVLSEPINKWQAYTDVYAGFMTEIIGKYDELPTVLISDEDNFKNDPAPVYKAVKREGVLYYG